jgi:hypothetical protein
VLYELHFDTTESCNLYGLGLLIGYKKVSRGFRR